MSPTTIFFIRQENSACSHKIRKARRNEQDRKGWECRDDGRKAKRSFEHKEKRHSLRMLQLDLGQEENRSNSRLTSSTAEDCHLPHWENVPWLPELVTHWWTPEALGMPQGHSRTLSGDTFYLSTTRHRVQQFCLYLLCLLLVLSKLPLRDRSSGQKGKQRTSRLLLQSKH